MEELIEKVKLLKLQPGDILVLNSDMSMSQKMDVMDYLRNRLGGNNICIMLPSNADLTVLSDEALLCAGLQRIPKEA